jgi:hypothetical protein
MKIPWLASSKASIERNWELALVSVLGGLLGASLIVAFAIVASHSAWNIAVAAWVQAGSATLAMAVAIGVAAWQSHQNRTLLREQANADLRRRLEALVGLLQAGNQEVWRCRRFLLRRGVGSRRDATVLARLVLPFDGELARLDGVMGAIALHELPSWDLANAVLLARQALSEARSVGALVFQQIEAGHSAPDPLVPQVELAQKAIKLALSAAERHLGAPLPAMQMEFPQDPPFEPQTPVPQFLPVFDVRDFGV